MVQNSAEICVQNKNDKKIVLYKYTMNSLYTKEN